MSDDPLGGKVTAPFTPDQVLSLNLFQDAGYFHPFTCGNDDCPRVDGEKASLVAAPGGWTCPADGCGYRQDWAHGFMADWSWRKGRADVVLALPDQFQGGGARPFADEWPATMVKAQLKVATAALDSMKADDERAGEALETIARLGEPEAACVLPDVAADWTIEPSSGRSNSSEQFLAIAREVERLIHAEFRVLDKALVAAAARLIVAQLAHAHGLAPRQRTQAGDVMGGLTEQAREWARENARASNLAELAERAFRAGWWAAVESFAAEQVT